MLSFDILFIKARKWSGELQPSSVLSPTSHLGNNYISVKKIRTENSKITFFYENFEFLSKFRFRFFDLSPRLTQPYPEDFQPCPWMAVTWSMCLWFLTHLSFIACRLITRVFREAGPTEDEAIKSGEDSDRSPDGGTG